MGYSNKIVLMDNVVVSAIFPFGLVQTAQAKVSTPLDQGQKVTFARIFCQIAVPQHLAGAVATVYFNGNDLGNINLPSSIFGGDTQYLAGSGNVDVTNFLDPNGNNALVVKCDGLSADLDFTIYADFFYELNTVQAPTKSPSLTAPPSPGQGPPSSNPPFSLPTWDQVKPYAIVAGVIVGGLIIGPPIISAIVRR